ncbi:PadR family transcriptional regulator [Thiotrichales bacterium 19X7-9]|nr:PadR family transcriptional regulator [Thiotrichales bacterium 19X7-9]
MPIKNKTTYAILGALQHKILTGYEIHKYITTSMKNYWNEGYNSIYPCLKKMLEQGYIQTVTTPSKKTNTKYYQITSLGLEQHRTWLYNLESNELARNENLLKIFFSSKSDIKQCKALIEYEKLKAESMLLLKNKDNSNSFNKSRMIDLYDQFILSAKLEWYQLMLQNI